MSGHHATPPRALDLDLRLAIGAASAWSAVLLGLSAAPEVVLSAAGGCLLLGALSVTLGRRRAWCAAVGLAAFCIALVLAPLGARLVRVDGSPLGVLAAHHVPVTAELRVTADPRPIAAGPAGAPRSVVDATVDGLVVAGQARAVHGSVLVFAPASAWRDVLPGQRVRVDGVLQPALGGGLLSATFTAQSDPQPWGLPPWWQRAAGSVRTSLRRSAAGLPEESRGLLPGLVDGDTTELDPVLAERFRLAGLTHLVAVSGTNCVIVLGAALLLLRRLRAGPVVCAVLGGAVLIAFVVVARPSPSVLRAAVMSGIALAALATGRPRAALPGLSACVLALLVWRPTLAADAGFAMSVLATAALFLIAPGWAAALRRRRVPPVLAEALAVAAAAHVVTAPVVAAISGRVSLVAVPANLLAEPVVAAATLLGFGAAVLGPVWSGGGAALAQLAGWPCRWLVDVADLFGGLHGATIGWPGGVGGGLLLLAAGTAAWMLALRAGPRQVLAVAAVVAVVALIPVRAVVDGWPAAGWVFVACDVGQGDALVLPAGPHEAVVVDSGPDPVAVDRCLADLGVDHVPLLVLSHYHLDHVGGIVGVLHGRRVDRVVTGPLDLPVSGVDLVHDALATRGTRIGSLVTGTSLDVGAVHLDVLGPAVAYRGTRSDPNNSSLALRATVRGVRILLPGDAEVEAQQAMVAEHVDLRADVLKVAHHGSAYFDPAFVEAVHARVAVVSVGLHNDYGHPSALALAEYARLGVPLHRTDHDGDVAVVADGSRLTAVLRGTRASTVGLGADPVSEARARMGACPSRRWFCSSETRSSWSPGPSARSPPRCGPPTPASS